MVTKIFLLLVVIASSLMGGIEEEYPGALQDLAKIGGDKEMNDNPSLIRAIDWKLPELALWLLKKHPEQKNSVSSLRSSPLYLAVKRDLLPVAQALIEANVPIRGKGKDSLFSLALKNKNEAMINLIFSRVPLAMPKKIWKKRLKKKTVRFADQPVTEFVTIYVV